MKNIFVLGSLNIDLVIQTEVIPKAGETLTGGAFNVNFGGKGANQAVAAKKLGASVFMAGAVGDDTFGKDILENLNFVGVNTDAVRTVSGINSGVAVITVCNGDNRIILSTGANGCVNCEDADALLSKANKGDIFVTQCEIPIPVVGYALKKAKEMGLITVLNPAPAVKEVKEFIPFADIITPNETELEILSGKKDVKQALADLNANIGIVTLGGEGYYYQTKDDSLSGKPIKVNVVDTTAAGDTFLGALCYKLSIGQSVKESLAFASKCASIACTKAGAQGSIPTLQEVENFI